MKEIKKNDPLKQKHGTYLTDLKFHIVDTLIFCGIVSSFTLLTAIN